jgi:hypothetical protein
MVGDLSQHVFSHYGSTESVQIVSGSNVVAKPTHLPLEKLYSVLGTLIVVFGKWMTLYAVPLQYSYRF